MTEQPQDSESRAKPRGLWSVIAHSSGPISSEDDSPVPAQPATEPGPRGLFEVMRRAQSDEETLSPIPADKATPDEEEQASSSALASGESLPVVQQPAEYITLPFDEIASVARSIKKPAVRRVRQASIALLCGLASVPLSALAIFPGVWMSIPASGLGFFAIISGYMALTGCRIRDLSSFTKIASQAGMLLGTLGLFLGPVVFAAVGRDLRESSGNQQTRKHLKAIGEGLDRFYQKNNAFPAGGTFLKEQSGAFRGQHGWMTFLLPYVNEKTVYDQIDFSKPFDAPENRKAMGHDIEIYFAAGGDRTKIGQGFSVSHFAGVGGEVDDEAGLLHAGIFTRDRAITKNDVTDGLSNTMVVGEVNGNYAPWGDPENWRTIGKGLNKDVNGFGNAAGTGAMFLFGDCSVRMFSNKADPRLLKQLSTRDGGESAN